MEYVKVESSQIDSVGFGEGVYGPETLGIRFKQKNGISEYHYDHVTARMYQALVAAESVGKYFGANIKNRPEFPYMKVETENPPQPPSTNGETSGRGSNAKPKSNENETQSSLPSETEVSNPGTSLAIIDKLDNSALFAAGGVTDAQLAAGREWYLAEAKKYDISTEAKRTELKRFARPLQKLRTGIEARAKEFTGETKRKIAAIDTEKRRLVQIVGEIEDAVLAPLTAWEQEEEARKTRLGSHVSDLSRAGENVSLYPDILSLESSISILESFDLSTMQEYKVGAESAIAASLRVLKPELERRKQAEKDAAELEALRAAEAKRQDDARIEAAAKELIAKTAHVDQPEPTLEVVEVVPFVYEQVPPDAPVVPFVDNQAVHTEIVEALQGCMLTRQQAISVLKAITEGHIPHVAITY